MKRIYYIKANSYKDAIEKAKLSYDELASLEKSLRDFLDDYGNKYGLRHFGLWYNFTFENYDSDILIEADIKGDWKHDHLLFNMLVNDWCKANEYSIDSQHEEYVDDGDSDYYEAMHYYQIKKNG